MMVDRLFQYIAASGNTIPASLLFTSGFDQKYAI
jgi:hypothetical protein